MSEIMTAIHCLLLAMKTPLTGRPFLIDLFKYLIQLILRHIENCVVRYSATRNKPVKMITSWVKWMNQAQNMPPVSAMDLASIGLESADDLIRDEPDAAGAHLQGAGRATGLSGDEKNYRVTATGPASPNLCVLALQEFPCFLASVEIFVIKLSNIAASAAFAWCCIIKFLHPFQHCACIVAFFSSAWF
jgi:hypothetical protein